jgi:protein deglycase
MKTLLFLARGFETMEFSVFVDVLGWARHDYGYDVALDTCGFKKQVTSTFHVPILVDKLIHEINIDEYDALAIPGGFEEFGFYEDAYDENFLELIRGFHAKKNNRLCLCSSSTSRKKRYFKRKKSHNLSLRGWHPSKTIVRIRCQSG